MGLPRMDLNPRVLPSWAEGALNRAFRSASKQWPVAAVPAQVACRVLRGAGVGAGGRHRSGLGVGVVLKS